MKRIICSFVLVAVIAIAAAFSSCKSDQGYWEYKVLRLSISNDEGETSTPDELNSLGKEGWELVAVTNNYGSSNSATYQFTFKRKL